MTHLCKRTSCKRRNVFDDEDTCVDKICNIRSEKEDGTRTIEIRNNHYEPFSAYRRYFRK